MRGPMNRIGKAGPFGKWDEFIMDTVSHMLNVISEFIPHYPVQ